MYNMINLLLKANRLRLIPVMFLLLCFGCACSTRRQLIITKYPNGNVYEKYFAYFEDAEIKDGPFLTFAENGQLISWKEFHNNVLDGKCIYWNAEGRIIRVDFYRQGKLLRYPKSHPGQKKLELSSSLPVGNDKK